MKCNPENSHRVTSYRFNGKEYDQETGNYYYGARYYDPKLSIWLSVDPLAHKFPAWSPYNFSLNNPINLVDSDGRAPGDPPRVSGNPMSYFYQGWTEMFQAAGQTIDNLGASVSAFFTQSSKTGTNTSVNTTRSVSAGTRFKDFVTPTKNSPNSDSKPSVETPFEVSFDSKTEAVSSVKVKGKIEGLDVTFQHKESQNVSTNEVKIKDEVTVGAGSSGIFASQTQSSEGSSTTEAGVKAQGTVSVGTSSITIGGKFSLSHEK